MRSLAVRAVLVAAAMGAATFVLVGTADASHVKVELSAPREASVGRPAGVQVTLRSAADSSPIANAPVTFYSEASFGGVTGQVELGRAVTDENGVAALTYEPRSAGEHQIRVEYLIPGESEPETATATTHVSAAGSTQLYRSTSGVPVPGLNVWLIIAVVTAVWAILMTVAVRVVAIARAAGEGDEAVEGAPYRQPSGGPAANRKRRALEA